MKRLIAISFIALHLFNIGGYLVLHQYFTYKSDRFFNEQTDKNKYNTGDLTEIRIPVNMPNIADWTCYENVSGSIRFENASYNYVKMKMTRNVLYLMCVPNYETTHLSSQNVIVAKNIKDIPVPKKQHIPYCKTNVLDVLKFTFAQYTFNIPVKKLTIRPNQPVQRLSTSCLDIPEQPPKSLC